MSAEAKGLAAAALVGVFALLSRRTLAASGQLWTAVGVRSTAEQIARVERLNADPLMVTRIAYIESSFNPSAVRAEPHINDASYGLMQTLFGTAHWLWRDMGYRALGEPTPSSLLDGRHSLYFGMAYLDWLSDYRGAPRGEEFIVRAYNGGPGYGAATDPYWRKYQQAKERFR